MLPAFVWARDWGRRSTSHSTAETAGVQGVTLPPWCLAGVRRVLPRTFLMLGYMFSGPLA